MENVISIIVPIFNSGKYLNRCLDSIINQTYQALEIICINDGSTDNSKQIIEEYQIADSRIKVIDNIENKGVSYSRNTGIEMASGEWIGFVDSDDWIHPDMYGELIKNGNLTNSDIVMSDLYVNEGNKTKDYSIKLEKTVYDKGEICQNLLPRFSLPGNDNLGLFSFTTKIFRRDIIQLYQIRFDLSTSYEEDKIFVINAFGSSNRVSYLNKNFYYYEVHPSGLYSNFSIYAWQWYVNNYNIKQSLIKKYNIENVNQCFLKEEFIYNINWFIKRCSSRLERRTAKAIKSKILSDSNIRSIFKECIPYLSSIDKIIAWLIVKKQSKLAVALINFSFSPYKNKLFAILQKLHPRK